MKTSTAQDIERRIIPDDANIWLPRGFFPAFILSAIQSWGVERVKFYEIVGQAIGLPRESLTQPLMVIFEDLQEAKALLDALGERCD